MKLICELQEAVDYELVEASTDKPKQYFIEGIFMQSEVKNKNGRLYPLEVLEREVNRYVKEYIEPKRALGELGSHQSTDSLQAASKVGLVGFSV